MKSRLLLFAALALAAPLARAASLPPRADRPPGFVQLGTFTRAETGGESVDIDFSGESLKAIIAGSGGHKAVEGDPFATLVAVRGQAVALDDANRDANEKHVRELRRQMQFGDWQRLTVAGGEPRDVVIFAKPRGQDSYYGFVITIIDGRQQVVCLNVIGDIRPERLGDLGDRLNLESLKKLRGVAIHPALMDAVARVDASEPK